jgi:hypothetical protein
VARGDSLWSERKTINLRDGGSCYEAETVHREVWESPWLEPGEDVKNTAYTLEGSIAFLKWMRCGLGTETLARQDLSVPHSHENRDTCPILTKASTALIRTDELRVSSLRRLRISRM